MTKQEDFFFRALQSMGVNDMKKPNEALHCILCEIYNELIAEMGGEDAKSIDAITANLINGMTPKIGEPPECDKEKI